MQEELKYASSIVQCSDFVLEIRYLILQFNFVSVVLHALVEHATSAARSKQIREHLAAWQESRVIKSINSFIGLHLVDSNHAI